MWASTHTCTGAYIRWSDGPHARPGQQDSPKPEMDTRLYVPNYDLQSCKAVSNILSSTYFGLSFHFAEGFIVSSV